jgi:hypothetical protein
LPVHRRDVINDVDVACGPLERRSVAEIADDEIDAVGAEQLRPDLVPHERAHGISTPDERTREMTACKAGRASN